MIASGEDSPEALSGFVKFHPQYPVLKVPGGASRPPCASRSRLARGCILRASPPRVKGKFGFGRIYCGARADSAEPSGFSQLMQSLPRGPCRPSLWRSLHNLLLVSMYFSPFSPTHFRQSRQRGYAGFANADAPLSASRRHPPSRPHRRLTRPSGGTTGPLS